MTGSELFIWALTVPALVVAVACAVLGKMSVASAGERAQEATGVVEKLQKLKSENEAWLAEHPGLLAPTGDASGAPPAVPDDAGPTAAPDGA